VVDWVRSCHHGTWRLFTDPNILTTGRYYFASEDTPHYPGWHNLGSADWTYAYDEAYQTPPLGEDREKRSGYSKGDLGIPSPDPKLRGSPDCIERGEVYPQAVPPEERQLVNGIPVECWDGVAPDPVPVLWLKPESLDQLEEGGQIERWPDSSVYENHARQPDPELRPFKSTIFGPSGAVSGQFNTLELLRPVRLRYHWTLFFVWGNGGSVFNPFLRSDLFQGLLRWQPTQWRQPSNGSRWIFNWPGGSSAGGFGMVQRDGAGWGLQRNAGVAGSFGTEIDEALGFQSVLPFTTGSFGLLPSILFEVKVFDGAISETQKASEVAYFAAKYGF